MHLLILSQDYPGFFNRRIRPEQQRSIPDSTIVQKNVPEKSGIPRHAAQNPFGFFAAALRANFAIAKFGIIFHFPVFHKTKHSYFLH